MQRENTYFLICIFLILLSGIYPNQVNAQSTLQSFQTNPLEFWNIQNADSVFNANSTITINQDGTISDTWFDSDFGKRALINITGSSGAGTNYQILVNVTYDSDMNSDFSDLRFTDNDKVTLLR